MTVGIEVNWRELGVGDRVASLTATANGLHLWQWIGDLPCPPEQVDDLLRSLAFCLAEPAADFSFSTTDSGSDQDTYVEPENNSYLPFFQLNLLFGGFYNPAFRPGVFFEEDDPLRQENSEVRVRDVLDPLMVGTELASQGAVELALTLEVAVRRFMAVTTEDSLLSLKWRLERTRRALLSSMLSIVHRKRSLTQFRERLDYPEAFERANETQIRGFVMLVASKLPLLTNVAGYLDAAIKEVKAIAGSEAISGAKREAKAWKTLLGAIGSNLKGLETAIEHAWMERLLYEQEQARAEQEALAEIERSRSREGVVSATVDSVFGAGVLILTIATFFALGQPSKGNTLKAELTLIAVGLLGAFVLWGIFRYISWMRRKRVGAQRHYYELNLRLDTPIEGSAVAQIMTLGEVRHAPRPETALLDVVAERRGSYRVERIDSDHALFKIHVEASVRLNRSQSPFGRSLRRTVPLHAIYELYHHRPSKEGEFIVREVRMVCHSSDTFSTEDLRELSVGAAETLIDPYLPEDESMILRQHRGIESSFVIFG